MALNHSQRRKRDSMIAALVSALDSSPPTVRALREASEAEIHWQGVVAACLYGSAALGLADAVSDVDVLLLTKSYPHRASFHVRTDSGWFSFQLRSTHDLQDDGRNGALGLSLARKLVLPVRPLINASHLTEVQHEARCAIAAWALREECRERTRYLAFQPLWLFLRSLRFLCSISLLPLRTYSKFITTGLCGCPGSALEREYVKVGHGLEACGLIDKVRGGFALHPLASGTRSSKGEDSVPEALGMFTTQYLTALAAAAEMRYSWRSSSDAFLFLRQKYEVLKASRHELGTFLERLRMVEQSCVLPLDKS